MKVTLLCVGSRMPSWVDDGVEDFAKRIRAGLGFTLIEIPPAKRGKSTTLAQCLFKEAESILDRIPAGAYVVAFDVKGKPVSTEKLVEQMNHLRHVGQDMCLLIGGPDGLHDSVLHRANVRWSLSGMVMPHGLVRVLVIEQLYRAQSIIQGHPYHRA